MRRARLLLCLFAVAATALLGGRAGVRGVCAAPAVGGVVGAALSSHQRQMRAPGDVLRLGGPSAENRDYYKDLSYADGTRQSSKTNTDEGAENEVITTETTFKEEDTGTDPTQTTLGEEDTATDPTHTARVEKDTTTDPTHTKFEDEDTTTDPTHNTLEDEDTSTDPTHTTLEDEDTTTDPTSVDPTHTTFEDEDTTTDPTHTTLEDEDTTTDPTHTTLEDEDTTTDPTHTEASETATSSKPDDDHHILSTRCTAGKASAEIETEDHENDLDHSPAAAGNEVDEVQETTPTSGVKVTTTTEETTTTRQTQTPLTPGEKLSTTTKETTTTRQRPSYDGPPDPSHFTESMFIDDN